MAESRDVELRLGGEVATLRLLDGERSLDELLAGEYAFRFWLTPVEGEPGVYRLSAMAAEHPSLEAICRALLLDEPADGEPPIPEPSGEVAEFTARWREFFDALRADAALDETTPDDPPAGEGE